MSDKWAEAWSRLTNAAEFAKGAGMTEEEAEDALHDVYAASDEPHVGGGPKRPKPKRDPTVEDAMREGGVS